MIASQRAGRNHAGLSAGQPVSENGMSKRLQARMAILDAIHRDVYPSGSRIPCERDLCVELGVSRMTLANVLRELAEEGWIERRVGSGTYVSERQVVSNRPAAIRSVGLVMNGLSSPVAVRLMEGIHHVLSPERCNLILKDPCGDPRSEMRYVEHLLSGGVDALVVVTSFPFDSAEGLRFYRAVSQRLPLVMTDCVLDGDVPTIEVDNLSAGALAAEYLRGCHPDASRFWALKSTTGFSTVEERVLGFQSAAGPVPVAVAGLPDDPVETRQAIRGLLAKGLPDGIFLTNEALVVRLLQTFEDGGVDREGIAICCCDDFHGLATLCGVAHVEQPFVAVGEEIARYLLLQQGSQNEPVRKLKLVPRLVLPAGSGKPSGTEGGGIHDNR